MKTSERLKAALQHIFDDGLRRLYAQGRKSVNETDKVCLYRGPCGSKCFFGGLIDDGAYNPGLENNPASAPKVLKALKASGYLGGLRLTGLGDDHSFFSALEDMQDTLHDRVSFESGADFRMSLLLRAQVFAEEYGLDSTVADKLLEEITR